MVPPVRPSPAFAVSVSSHRCLIGHMRRLTCISCIAASMWLVWCNVPCDPRVHVHAYCIARKMHILWWGLPHFVSLGKRVSSRVAGKVPRAVNKEQPVYPEKFTWIMAFPFPGTKALLRKRMMESRLLAECGTRSAVWPCLNIYNKSFFQYKTIFCSYTMLFSRLQLLTREFKCFL